MNDDGETNRGGDDDRTPIEPAHPFRIGVGRPHPVLPHDRPPPRRSVHDDHDVDHDDGRVDDRDHRDVDDADRCGDEFR